MQVFFPEKKNLHRIVLVRDISPAKALFPVRRVKVSAVASSKPAGCFIWNEI